MTQHHINGLLNLCTIHAWEKMEGNGDSEENHKEKKKLPLKSECLYIDIETVPGPLELK